MKRLNVFLLLFFAAQMLTAQIRFSVEVKNYFADFIFVEKPVRGKFFPQEPEKVLAGKKGRFLVETTDSRTGFLTIHLGEGRDVRVFLEPGRTSSMSVDMDNFEKSLKFSGPQADQNKFLNGLDRSAMLPLFDSFTSRSGGGDEMRPKDYYLSVVDHIDAEKKVLKRKGKKRFSEAFKQAMEQDIEFYHTCRFTNMVADEYQKHISGEQSKFTSKWAEYWTKAYQIPDFQNPLAGVTEYYLRTLDHYLGAYRLGYLEENEYLDPDLAMGEQYLEFDRLLWKDFSGELLEYSIAGVISQRAMMGRKEPILYDLFLKFKNDFPNSPYLKPFETVVAPIGSYLEEEKFVLPEGIFDLNDFGEFSSVDDILRQFPGKVVYVDIWATWCSPCLFEFRQKKPLEEFIEDKDIVLLFVSVDEPDREERWRKTISENNLRGYHILADYSLRDELISRFGEAGNLALPQYLIFDKTGNIGVVDAKKPSHNSLLFRQLEQYLNQ